MLELTSACNQGSLATIFTVSPDAAKDTTEQVKDVVKRMDERFRCGEKPEPGHSPMIGKLAFVEGEAAPAVSATLIGILCGLFDYVCAKDPSGDYLVTAIRSGERKFKIGDRIPAKDIHMHQDKDIWK